MGHIVYSEKVELLNQELLKLLQERSEKALEVIDNLKRIGLKEKDNNLIGYAYYRYSYYYYFTDYDLALFHKNVQKAIEYLLRSDNKEYLGGAYNLIAYDAQDLGCYDVAYAYFGLAYRASKEIKDIALPDIVEANSGRLLIEMGEASQGIHILKRVLKNLEKTTSLQIYHYNMVITFSDEILGYFIIRDLDGVESAQKEIAKHFELASEEEKALCSTYNCLANLYVHLMRKETKSLTADLKTLSKIWKDINDTTFVGLVLEIEELFKYMIEQGYIKQAKRLLELCSLMKDTNNLSVAMRYNAMLIQLDEVRKDNKQLAEHLFIQHKLEKHQAENAVRLRKYAIEFSNMIVNISNERMKVREENKTLRVQANTDSLTKLPNRNAMNKRLAQMIQDAVDNGKNFGIGIVDIDFFKEYNDTFGHQAGDECLRRIGGVLSSFITEDLFCARYGGDEFVIGYYGYSDKEIKNIAKKMEAEVAKINIKHRKGKIETVQISQGFFNTVPNNAHKLWDFLSEADRRLYKIKKSKSI